MNPTSNCICKHSEGSHYSLNGMGSGCIACDCPVFRPAPKPEALGEIADKAAGDAVDDEAMEMLSDKPEARTEEVCQCHSWSHMKAGMHCWRCKAGDHIRSSCAPQKETIEPSGIYELGIDIKNDAPQKEGTLWCDGGVNCRCVCHQKSYSLPKDFPAPQKSYIVEKAEADFEKPIEFAPQKENKWEEEFDNNFNGDWCLMHCVDINKKDLAPIIKSFIHSLIREAEEKIRKQSQRQILDLTDEIVKTHAAALKEVEEEIIPQHNARILNQFQLQGTPDMPFIAYDERVCLAPAMETATKETLFTLKEKSQQ